MFSGAVKPPCENIHALSFGYYRYDSAVLSRRFFPSWDRNKFPTPIAFDLRFLFFLLFYFFFRPFEIKLFPYSLLLGTPVLRGTFFFTNEYVRLRPKRRIQFRDPRRTYLNFSQRFYFVFLFFQVTIEAIFYIPSGLMYKLMYN